MMKLLPVIFAIYLCGLLQLGEAQQQPVTPTWRAKFTPNATEVHMGTEFQVFLELESFTLSTSNIIYQLQSKNDHLATIQQTVKPIQIDGQTGKWQGNLTGNALFLGTTRIVVVQINTNTNATDVNEEDYLQVTVVRRMRIIDHVFAGSVAILVSLLYINFGAALDLTVLGNLVKRPVGPGIGFINQCLLMPLISYGLGLLIFPNSVEMQLGLFFTGVSPSGGASNIWSVILGGNINLSVLMTTISNFAAFFTMPLWLFTLGSTIFERGDLEVPYQNIAQYAACLIIPLAIGVGIQKCSPRTTRVLVRLLKPISTALILFIIVFAIATNLYLFELFSWQIVLAGLGLPWLGYIFAWLVAKLFHQNTADALTIAIETGIQNTGISIFLLRFSLPQPQADLTTVIPVSVAIMTPFPLLGMYIYKRCAARGIKDAERDPLNNNFRSSNDHRIVESNPTTA